MNAGYQQHEISEAGQWQQAHAFRTLFHTACAEGLPVACWRKPGDDQFHLIIDLSGAASRVKPDIANLPEGFLLAPFERSEDGDNHLIKADLYFNSQSRQLRIHPALQNTSNSALERFMKQLDQSITSGNVSPAWHAADLKNNGEGQDQSTHGSAYEALVAKAVDAIKNGRFEKVVPARTKQVDLPEDFSITETFESITRRYPNAFASLVSIPGLGTWMGATPETLISIDEAGIFRTVALAGTQAYSEGTDLREVAWRQKEIEEQALVSRYIINCFKRIRLREFTEKGPSTIIAANLMHLKTTFEVDTRAVNFPELPSVMLDLLHPTSAVCGMPKEAALDFLHANEGFDRSLFAGYLGPVNFHGQSHLFVNLRCMQIHQDRATLYAGAGVTADSVPEREWQETEHKCQTLLSIINR